MKVTYHGHSVVTILTDDGTHLLFDPFINGHEACDLDADTVKADYILLTHAHSDHFGDTIDIVNRTGATVITTVEIAEYLNSKDIKAHGMQPGGGFNFDFGRVTLTPAIHGSSLKLNPDDDMPTTLGLASGILVTINDKTFYHVGDTALYSDMQLIGDMNDIDLAFVPIGDNFTMGPEDAAVATKWLKAKQAVPIHYSTFPMIEQDPNDFVKLLDEGVGKVLAVGDSIEL